MKQRENKTSHEDGTRRQEAPMEEENHFEDMISNERQEDQADKRRAYSISNGEFTEIINIKKKLSLKMSPTKHAPPTKKLSRRRRRNQPIIKACSTRVEYLILLVFFFYAGILGVSAREHVKRNLALSATPKLLHAGKYCHQTRISHEGYGYTEQSCWDKCVSREAQGCCEVEFSPSNKGCVTLKPFCNYGSNSGYNIYDSSTIFDCTNSFKDKQII